MNLDALELAVADLTDRYDDARYHGPGLLILLADPAQRTKPITEAVGGARGKPASRPPAGSVDAHDLLAHIEAGVIVWDADLRDALDDHLGYERPWLEMLAALPGLAFRLPRDSPLGRPLTADAQRWVRACRIALGFLERPAPRTLTCPFCSQCSIVTSTDRGVSAWCRTPECVDDHGDRVRWDASTIALLLASQPQEATA